MIYCFLIKTQASVCDSPGGRSHDAAPSVYSHPAAASPLWSVVVHPEVVTELMGQCDGGTKWVVRMVLRYNH